MIELIGKNLLIEQISPKSQNKIAIGRIFASNTKEISEVVPGQEVYFIKREYPLTIEGKSLYFVKLEDIIGLAK